MSQCIVSSSEAPNQRGRNQTETRFQSMLTFDIWKLRMLPLGLMLCRIYVKEVYSVRQILFSSTILELGAFDNTVFTILDAWWRQRQNQERSNTAISWNVKLKLFPVRSLYRTYPLFYTMYVKHWTALCIHPCVLFTDKRDDWETLLLSGKLSHCKGSWSIWENSNSKSLLVPNKTVLEFLQSDETV